MKIGSYVDIKEHRGGGRWSYEDIDGNVRRGHVTAMDEHCLSVRTDDGENIRDVRDHFRPAK